MLVEPLSCSLPLPNRVPGQNYSYSDHEAVDAVIRLRKATMKTDFPCGAEGKSNQNHVENMCTTAQYKREQSMLTRLECVKSVEEAIKVTSATLLLSSLGNIVHAYY